MASKIYGSFDAPDEHGRLRTRISISDHEDRHATGLTSRQTYLKLANAITTHYALVAEASFRDSSPRFFARQICSAG